MIRYATLHHMGSRDTAQNLRRWRYIFKYFDPLEPLEPLTCEYVGFREKPETPGDTCLVEERDAELYTWVQQQATADMRNATLSVFWNDELYVFADMWSDKIGPDAQVFGKPLDPRKALLFLLWDQLGIGFNRRLFLECMPNMMQRTGRWTP